MAQKIITERGARIEFVSISELGEDKYYYLYITEADFTRMQKDINLGIDIKPKDYGIVIFDGEGTERNPEAEKRILEILNKNSK